MGLFITERVTKDVDEEAQPAGWERGVGAPCFLFAHDTQMPAGVQQGRCSCMIEWCQYHGVKSLPSSGMKILKEKRTFLTAD